MLRSWRNFRAQAGWADGHVAGGTPPQPYPPPPKKSPGRMPNGVSPGARQGTLTELLQEDARHLLGEDPAHPDEAGEVPPSAELHDQVDVVAVPLRGKWTPSRHPGRSHRVSHPHKVRLDRFAQLLARNPTDTPLGSQDGPQDLSWTSPPDPGSPQPHLEVLELHDVRVADGLQDLDLRQQVFHRCPVEAPLAHALDGHHLTRVPLPRGKPTLEPLPHPKQANLGVLPQSAGGGEGGVPTGEEGERIADKGVTAPV